MANELFHASVVQLSDKLARKEVSAVELAQAFLDRIEQHKDLNAYLDVRPEATLQQAKLADERIARGEATRLTGIPIAHKDLFVTKEWATTAASKMLEGYMSPFNATVVENLNRAGMVCLGKLNFTGVTGLKPTYGRPSRWGVIAFASSLDTPGLLAHSAEDCDWVMNEMIEFDPKDSTCVDLPKEDFTRCLDMSMDGVKIGVPRSWFAKGLDEELAASIEDVIRTYERMGAKIVDIELPTVGLGVPVYYVVACAEASSNLSRYDGVRYGYRAKHYTDIQDMIKRSRSEALGAEPQRRIMIGTYVLSHGYYDAYYIKAQRVRRLIANELNNVCQQVDAIISPAATGPAYRFGEKSDPVQAYLSDLYTVPISWAGLPGMGLPCGLHSNGLPLGFQLVSARFNEAKLLGIAHRYQCETDWHKRVPAGY